MFRALSRACVPRKLNPFSSKALVRRVSTQSASLADHDYTTLVEMATNSIKKYSKSKVFGTRVGSTFEWITYEQFGREVSKFRNVLHHHGFSYNDKLALISNNRVEWAVAAFAAQSLGGQVVPMYEVQPESEWRYIAEDSGASLLLVATDAIYDKTASYVGKVGNVRTVMCMDADSSYMHSYKHWMKTVEGEPSVSAYAPEPSDLCSIIYTSGTTGKPKGVLLTHANIASNLQGISGCWPGALGGHTSLAFLPWAHVYGQTCELFSLFANGSAMGIVASRETIVESFALLKPSMLCSVPALFNRIHDGILKTIASSSSVTQALFKRALFVARKRNHRLEFGHSVPLLLRVQHALFDRLVFSKIRARLGGNLKFMSAGGAATSLPVLQFFEDIGIPIANGYGLTETSPIVTLSSMSWVNRRLGTCGVLLQDVHAMFIDPANEIEVAPGMDGELCVSGPNVMVGYHNKPDATNEVFLHRHGRVYFRTGDLGHMEDGRFLRITGRIKEQFKLENGKYVVPVPLEDAVARSTFIAQAVLYGDNRKTTVLLIVPDWVEVKAWAIKFKIARAADLTPEALATEPSVIALLAKEIEDTPLKSYERPSRFDIIIEAFTAESQMMTPKSSVRRPNVIKRYQILLDGMYAGTGGHKLTNASSKLSAEDV